MVKEIINKKGQVAIFIILGLILVILILLVFFLRRPPTVNIIDEKNPQSFIDSCTREAVTEAIEILDKNGGDIESKGSVMFEGQNITYLCYNSNYYSPCVNQRPLLIEHLEKEITDYINPLIEDCFTTLETELEKKYSIDSGAMILTTSLAPKQVSVIIDKNLKMTRGEETFEFEKFEINLVHPLYDLAETAMEIANQESRFCNFETAGFMFTYPNYDIKKISIYDSNKIYKVKHLPTNQEFIFAIRSCALPAGL